MVADSYLHDLFVVGPEKWRIGGQQKQPTFQQQNGFGGPLWSAEEQKKMYIILLDKFRYIIPKKSYFENRKR